MKLKFLLILLLVPQLGFSYYLCRPCCSRFQLPGWWGSGEYLYLWRKARFYPPLVTTNPDASPLLSDPETTVLFGNESVGGNGKSGGRADLGFWLTHCLGFGITAFTLGQDEVNFNINGSDVGTPIFGRPFFNTNTGLDDALLLSFPVIQINGSVEIDTSNRLWGIDFYARRSFFRTCCFKFDMLGGFQFNRIIDSVDITSQTTAVIGPITTKISDHFSCENSFYGGLVGLFAEWRSRNWAISVVGKLGIGNMRKEIEIEGSTVRSILDVVFETTQSGLLAQPSNIGEHKPNQWEVVPQINADIQLRVWNHFWVTLGYMYMYWQNVALAGEQIDLNVNPTQVPGPAVGPLAPLFNDVKSSFWIQGITAGIRVCY